MMWGRGGDVRRPIGTPPWNQEYEDGEVIGEVIDEGGHISSCVSISEDDTASSMLFAAYNNNVHTLIPLLNSNSSTWFERARERQYGFNLLQIAILRECDQVFDYLISLDDHYVSSLMEAVDFAGSTALVVALSYRTSSPISGAPEGRARPITSERYAYQLIEKGADINKKSRRGWSMLHCAIERGFLRTARSLIEKGADVNSIVDDGIVRYTPLHLCFSNYNDVELVEAISMLLINGADPSIASHPNGDTIFDILCRHSYNKDLHAAVENVFLFTYDELSSCEINFDSLLMLAENKCPFFFELLTFTPKIILGGRSGVREWEHFGEYPSIDTYALYPLMIDTKFLCALLENVPSFVKILLNNYSSCYSDMYRFDIGNIDLLMTSNRASLYGDTIELISNINCGKIISCFLRSMRMTDDQFREKVLPIIYYLCSYGMTIDVMDLERIYTMTGLTEDFKNLIFMLADDVDSGAIVHRPITDLIPRLFYDVSLDIHELVDNISLCRSINWKQMFQYFVHPKIKNAYLETITMMEYEWWWYSHQAIIPADHYISSSIDVVKNIDDLILPRVPLLQELSRDAFRKYFIKRFNITGAKRFHSLIKLLPISHVHEKIITFETKLYNNCIF